MGQPTSATVEAPHSDEQSGNAALRLGGYRLLIARGVWLLLFVGILAEFLVSLPGYFPTVEQLCPQTCFFTRETAQTFAHLEISVSVFAWVTLAIYGILVVASSILAAILFWRRSHEWMVLLVAYFLVAYPISNLVVASSSNPFATPASLVLVSIPAITVFYAVFLLFPSGRFVPGWSWVLLLVWVVSITVGSIWPNTPYVVAYPICYGGAIVCQIFRYLRVSTPVQRLQTKWVVFGFVASLLANQAFWLLPEAVGEFYRPIFFLVYLLLLLFVPFTFFIAVQRYHLYDIDVIINRALVYGSLTVILAGVYIGGILSIQSLLALLTRQAKQAESPLAIVASTLVIAALFQPMRHRLQTLIDRRFYRKKYDAEMTLEAFSATLRQEVDLEQLRAQLLATVQETMQPEQVALWLRRPDQPHAE